MGYMDMLILQMPIANIFIVFNVHSGLKLLLKENRHFIWLIISLHALEKDPRLLVHPCSMFYFSTLSY